MSRWLAAPILATVGVLPVTPSAPHPCATTPARGEVEAYLRLPRPFGPGDVVVIAGPAEGRERVCGLHRETYPVVIRFPDEEPAHGALAAAPGSGLTPGTQLRVTSLTPCDADPAHLHVALSRL